MNNKLKNMTDLEAFGSSYFGCRVLIIIYSKRRNLNWLNRCLKDHQPHFGEYAFKFR